MKTIQIAVAASGLGVVNRGIEAWAKGLAEGLHREGIPVILFHGGGSYNCSNRRLRYLPRTGLAARMVCRCAPGFAWRWDLKSLYGIEQRTFAWALLRELRRWDEGILHTQDVVVAQMVERARKRGTVNVGVILAHGTNEPDWMLGEFGCVQHLTPMDRGKGGESDGVGARVAEQMHFVIPNFVDTDKFTPSPAR